MSNATFLETLFISCMNDNKVSCTAFDFRSGTNLMNYKNRNAISDCCASAHSLNIFRTEYVICANMTKPTLHIWPINSQDQIKNARYVVPGIVTALALSPDGYYLLAGIDESVYIWHTGTGRMLNTLSKHFQTIVCLYFNDNGSHFASGAKDGMIIVWNLTQVVSRTYDDKSHEPLYTFSDHALSITDMHIGVGGIRSFLYSVSLDKTCKIYDLSNGMLLLDIEFPEGIQSVTVNGWETKFYVGTVNGSILEFHITAPPRSKECYTPEKSKPFIGHNKGSNVNCLKLSYDAQTLISGGSDNQVIIWHIPSRQLVRTLIQKGPITNLSIQLTNPVTFHPETKLSDVFCCNLKRVKDSVDIDDDEEIEILVTTNMFEERDNKEISAFKPSKSVNNVDCNEMEDLKDEIKRLRAINKSLFVTATKFNLRKKKKINKNR